jgi:hypothetical protein
MVSIYPNPTSGAIEIELSDIQFQRFSIIDLDGKVIFQKSPVDQKENVDLSGFDDGLYIIILETNNESYKMKIIKE